MKEIQNDKFNCSTAQVWIGHLGFYIIADSANYKFYLHKDGNVYDGATPVDSGWFKSREEAQGVLDKAKEIFCAKNKEKRNR